MTDAAKINTAEKMVLEQLDVVSAPSDMSEEEYLELLAALIDDLENRRDAVLETRSKK
jgi:hypothetical protein